MNPWTVVFIHFGLAIGCFGLFFKVKQWRNQLIQTRAILIAWEHRLSITLPQSTQQLTLNQAQIQGVHQQYRQLKRYRHQLHQLLTVIKWGQGLMVGRRKGSQRRHRRKHHHGR